jgi:hypothetical protein
MMNVSPSNGPSPSASPDSSSHGGSVLGLHSQQRVRVGGRAAFVSYRSIMRRGSEDKGKEEQANKLGFGICELLRASSVRAAKCRCYLGPNLTR